MLFFIHEKTPSGCSLSKEQPDQDQNPAAADICYNPGTPEQ